MGSEAIHEQEPDRAAEDFARRRRINRSLAGGNKFAAERDDNAYLGQNILREEIGYFDDPLNAIQPYNFDEATRDTLLAHSRQDIASTYAHALSSFKYAFLAYQRASHTRTLAWVICLISIANFLVLASIVWGRN